MAAFSFVFLFLSGVSLGVSTHSTSYVGLIHVSSVAYPPPAELINGLTKFSGCRFLEKKMGRKRLAAAAERDGARCAGMRTPVAIGRP
jgi:hypothetical protein